jgi:hypothetical protein
VNYNQRVAMNFAQIQAKKMIAVAEEVEAQQALANSTNLEASTPSSS